MTDAQQRKAAKEFAAYWKDKGYEKGESQAFWLSLLRDVYGVEHPEQFVSFEEQVYLDHTSFIDGYISETKVMIEQKGLGKDLNKPIKQSDGTLLSPFQQAKRCITELPVSQHPRWVVTCNFNEFYVYDMERPGGEPEKILLSDLEKEYYRLSFLVDRGNVHLQREMEVSIAAGEIVGLLYDALLKQYVNPTSADFDWSEISPTIFGAVFESTSNPETRRSGGMHYTSIENIHKVIDPLFLDDLKKELEEIKSIQVYRR